MTSSKFLTFKVVLFTFLSVYISIFYYSLILPVVFFLGDEDRIDFWRKMLLVVNVIGPIAVAMVYFFYRPVAKHLKSLEMGTPLTDSQMVQSEKVFRRIENFLFFVGALSYLMGGLLNLGLDLVRGQPADSVYWTQRIILAITFGPLNGIISARLVNLAWLPAKYRMGITKFSSNRHRLSTFVKIGVPAMLILFVALLFSFVGVLNLFRYLDNIAPEQLWQHFALLFCLQFGFSLTLLFILLWENQAHIKNLQSQIDRLSSGSMNLSRRINIISFDDIGYLTAGMNRIMDDLQETFRQVDLSEDKVSETTNQTKVIVEQSQSRAQRIAELMNDVQQTESKEVEIIRRVVEDFENTLGLITEAIRQAQEQGQFIQKTSVSMNALMESFREISKLTLDANERFQLLSKTLDKGRNGLTRLLKHSARGCNPVMPTDALNR